MLVVHFIGAQEVSREICSLALTSTTSYTPLSTKDLEIQPTRNNQKLWPIHLNMRFTIKCILSKITCMQSVLELFFRPHFGIISKNKICVTKFCNILSQVKMYFFINRNRQRLQCVFFTKYQVHTKLEKENCLASKQANLQFQRQFTQAIVNSYGLETGKSWGKLRVLLVSCIAKISNVFTRCQNHVEQLSILCLFFRPSSEYYSNDHHSVSTQLFTVQFFISAFYHVSYPGSYLSH